MLLETVLSLVSGGATGLLGSVISRVADFKLEKMRGEHKLLMVDKETEQMKLESEYKITVVNRESEAAEDVAASQALSASYQADSASYLAAATGKVSAFFMGFVDFMRGIIRPGMTIYLTILTTIIAMQLHSIIDWADTLSPQELYATWREVINTVLYLTTSAVLWWFGSRPKARN